MLRPDQDLSVQILSRISQQLDTLIHNQTGSPLPMPTLNTFQPTSRIVRTNVLWLVSLLFSIGAALGATLIQQWVRDYKEAVQRRRSPLKRAPIRTLLYKGIMDWNMLGWVDNVPILLHLALFFFLAGLVDFLGETDCKVWRTSLALLLIVLITYIVFTLGPIFILACPFNTPITGLSWWLFQKSHAGLRQLLSLSWDNVPHPYLTEFRAQCALKRPLIGQAICWMMEWLEGDEEIMPLVDGIPGFLHSEDGQQAWRDLMSSADSQCNSVYSNSVQVLPNSEVIHTASYQSYNTSMKPVTAANFGIHLVQVLKGCMNPMVEKKTASTRAIACLHAVQSLLVVPGIYWEPYFSRNILQVFVDLKGFADDSVNAQLACTSAVLLSKVLQDQDIKEKAKAIETKLTNNGLGKQLFHEGVSAMVAAKKASSQLRVILEGLNNALDGLYDATSSLKMPENPWKSCCDAARISLSIEIGKLKKADCQWQHMLSSWPEALHEIQQETSKFQPFLKYAQDSMGMQNMQKVAYIQTDKNKSDLPVMTLLALGWLYRGMPALEKESISTGIVKLVPVGIAEPQFSLLTSDVMMLLVLHDVLNLDHLSGDRSEPSAEVQKKLRDMWKHCQEMPVWTSYAPDLQQFFFEKQFCRTQMWWLQDLQNGGTAFTLQFLLSELQSSPSLPSQDLLDTLHHITSDLDVKAQQSSSAQVYEDAIHYLLCQILWDAMWNMDWFSTPVINFLIHLIRRTVEKKECKNYLYELLTCYSTFHDTKYIQNLLKEGLQSPQVTDNLISIIKVKHLLSI